MAQQPQTIRSKGLLITAVTVGVIAVVLYNVQLYQVRKSYEKPTVKLLKVNRDVGVSRRLTEEDLETVEIDKSLQQSLGNVLLAREADYATSKVLRKPVQKGQWLTWAHFDADRAGSPSAFLSGPDFVTYPLRVDPDMTPGDTLRRGDLIDVWADVYVPGRQGTRSLQPRRVLEAARVITVGNQGPVSGDDQGEGDPTQRRVVERYRKVNIEIRRDEFDIMWAIETNIPDRVWRVTLVHPDVRLPDRRGEITDEALRKLPIRAPMSDRPSGLSRPN